MKRRSMLAAAAVATVLAACTVVPTPAPSGPQTVIATLPGGQVLTLIIDDETGMLDGVAPATPERDFHQDENKLDLKNPVGDPRRLLVTWVGDTCPKTRVEVRIKRTAAGLAISIMEPRVLQRCDSDVGTVKTIELRFRSPVPEASVEGMWLPG